MEIQSPYLSKSLFVICTVLFSGLININEGYGGWVTRQATIGEGLPVFVASNTSSDQTVRFNVEFPPDETCRPWLYIDYNPQDIDVEKIKNIAIQSGQDNAFQLTFHKANNRMLQLQTHGPLLMKLLQSLQKTEVFKFIMSFEATEMIKVFYRGNSSLAICSAQESCWSSFLNESDFIFPHSHEKLIEKDALNYLPKYVLKIARNEIFARHGYLFKNSRLHQYFSKKKWYQPHQGNIVTTALEKKNIKRILRFEKSVQMACLDKKFSNAAVRKHARRHDRRVGLPNEKERCDGWKTDDKGRIDRNDLYVDICFPGLQQKRRTGFILVRAKNYSRIGNNDSFHLSK